MLLTALIGITLSHIVLSYLSFCWGSKDYSKADFIFDVALLSFIWVPYIIWGV